MKSLNEHPFEFQIEKAFSRFKTAPKKVVFFDLRFNQGVLFSFQKHRNIISKALIVLQHGKRSPAVIKLEAPLQEKDARINLIFCAEKCEIALYVKSGNEEYADYFRPGVSKNSKFWAMFELQDGVYGILFDSEKPSVTFGFDWLNPSLPNPFDLMSMGVKPTVKFSN